MSVIQNDPILNEDIKQCAASWKGFQNQVFYITGATGLVGSMIIKSILYANDAFGCKNKVIAAVRNPGKLPSVLGEYAEREGFSYEEISLEQPIRSESAIE